jgi:polysaccharide export outer membrane protein/exopolysaccharide production protein ExoF
MASVPRVSAARSKKLRSTSLLGRIARRVLIAAASACLLLLSQPGAMAAQAPDYVLGPQDKLRLKVYEWRTTMNAVFEWTSLNEEFTIGPSGALSLPLLGEIPAAGLTTSQLARSLGESLKLRIGLAEAPNIAVEIVQYRPFYIIGAVNRPGEYPYRPELTVLQALSIAGGLLGTGEAGLRLGREIIQSAGESQYSEAEANGLLARKARLEAELKGLDRIAFPPELDARKNDASIATIMRQEITIFEARRNALRTEIEVLERLKGFLEKGMESLEAQLKAQQRERDLMRKELEGVASLVGRGLAPNTRQYELERAVARLEVDRLRLETEFLRAKQDISRTEVAIVEARNKVSNEAAANLRETQTKLEQAVAKVGTAQQLLHESRYTFPQLLAARRQDSQSQPVYRVVRRSGAQAQEIVVAESTRLEPGDTLKVELPLPDLLAPTPPAQAARTGTLTR